MNLSVLLNKAENLLFQRNVFAIFCGILALSNILLGLAYYRIDKQIILVPPHLGKEVAISAKKLSISYLEEITTYYISKLLDLTSKNIDFQTNSVLRNTHPASLEKMKSFFLEEKKRYAEYNLTTLFVPSSMEIDEDHLEVFVTGTLISRFGSLGKSEERNITYKISYDYMGGILTIKDFEAVKEDEKTN